MTDKTLSAIDRARAFVDGAIKTEQPGYAGMFALAREFADALVELGNRELKPFKGDRLRVDHGDYVRASGLSICTTCGEQLVSHPHVPGFVWLRRGCDGRLVKL